MSQDQPATGTIKALSFAKTAGAFVLALATLITAVAAALYIVAPELRPKDQLGATIDKIAVTQDSSYSTYSARRGYDAGLDDPQTPGIEVFVHARLMAYRDRSYSVGIELHEADTLRRLDVEMDGDFIASCENMSPKADDETATWHCWTTSPPLNTRYFARAILYDNGRTEDIPPEQELADAEILDFLDGPVLTVPD